MQFGAFFSALGACKKALDVINDVNGVPEAALHLWRVCDSLQPALQLVVCLNSRSETTGACQPALALVHEVLAACELILIRSQPDGRPYEAESWGEWWGRVPANTKDSISRVQLLPQLTNKVVHCATALQLAVQSCLLITRDSASGASVGLHAIQQGASYEGLVTARRILHLFEMGRLNSQSKIRSADCEAVYQIGQGRVYDGRNIIGVDCAFVLARSRVCKGARTPAYALHVLATDDLEDVRQQSEPKARSSHIETRHREEFIIVPRAVGDTATSEASNRSVVALATIALNEGAGVRGKAFVGRIRDNGECEDFYSNRRSRPASTAQQKLFFSIDRGVSADKMHFEFQSCTVPGQFCYFPLGNETYHVVTIEVLTALFLLIRRMHREKKAQVDEVWPCDIDEDEAALESWASTFDDQPKPAE